MSNRISLAVLISGGGTTLRNLIEKQERGELQSDIRLVIASNPNAGGLGIARRAGIPCQVIQRKESPSAEDFCERNFHAIQHSGASLVVMGGYLQHLLIPAAFQNRVINIHPSLIPAFSGKGFYGLKVHQAAIDYGVKISGCTVHFVDNEYDHGPIIAQRHCAVLSNDTPVDLQKRVFVEECLALPEVINSIAQGRLQIDGRLVSISPASGC